MPADLTPEQKRIDLENLIAETARQIERLRINLLDNEQAWKALGFSEIANPIAASLRRNVARTESILKGLEVALTTSLDTPESD